MLNVGSIFFGKGGNPSGGGGGAVESVTGDEGIFVNNGDPLNPVVEWGGDFDSPQAITAQLESPREIFVNGNPVFFTLDVAAVSGPTRSAVITPSDPFVIPNMGGFQVEENISAFGHSERKGYTLFSLDNYQTTIWARRSANDGTYFGTTYGNTLAPGQAGFTFFDNGMSAAGQNNISLGLFDTDTDDGFSFQVKGNMSLYFVTPVTPPTNANSAGLAWDAATNQVQGALLNNGLSVDTSSGEIAFVLGNDVGDPSSPAQFSSAREILTNGFDLQMTDNAGNVFSYGNSHVVGNNAAGYSMDLLASDIAFFDPTGVYEATLSSQYLTIADNSGNENQQSSTNIQLSNILNPNNFTNIQNQTIRLQDGVEFVTDINSGLVDVEDTVSNNYGHFTPDELLLSNGISGGGSSLSQVYFAVNAPAAASAYGIADFWGGGITTADPNNPTSQGGVIEIGQIVTAAVALDTTRYLAGSLNGSPIKILLGL